MIIFPNFCSKINRKEKCQNTEKEINENYE